MRRTQLIAWGLVSLALMAAAVILAWLFNRALEPLVGF